MSQVLPRVNDHDVRMLQVDELASRLRIADADFARSYHILNGRAIKMFRLETRQLLNEATPIWLRVYEEAEQREERIRANLPPEVRARQERLEEETFEDADTVPSWRVLTFVGRWSVRRNDENRGQPFSPSEGTPKRDENKRDSGT